MSETKKPISSEIKKKEVEPSYYSIVVEKRDSEGAIQQFLQGIVEYSYDDAYDKVVKKANAETSRGNWRCAMWYKTSVSEILSQGTTFDIGLENAKKVYKPQSIQEEGLVNGLMKKIIGTRDKELYLKTQEFFSENQQKYLDAELKKYVQS